MPRDHRNNYALFWRGRYQGEVRGYRDALAARHALASFESARCGALRRCILDTPAVSQCCGCHEYCTATISREVSK